MRHLREVSDDEVSLDILPECECELGLVCAECCILEYFLNSHGISLLIRDFYADKTKTWNRCLDTDTLCLERECEVFFEGLNLRESHSLRRPETILDNCRTDTLILHLDIDTELEECLLYQE